MGTKGCVNYNPMLGIRQLGYSICGPPSNEAIQPFIARGLNEEHLRMHQQIRKARDSPNRRDKELRKREAGVVGSIHDGCRIGYEKSSCRKRQMVKGSR